MIVKMFYLFTVHCFCGTSFTETGNSIFPKTGIGYFPWSYKNSNCVILQGQSSNVDNAILSLQKSFQSQGYTAVASKAIAGDVTAVKFEGSDHSGFKQIVVWADLNDRLELIGKQGATKIFLELHLQCALKIHIKENESNKSQTPIRQRDYKCKDRVVIFGPKLHAYMAEKVLIHFTQMPRGKGWKGSGNLEELQWMNLIERYRKFIFKITIFSTNVTIFWKYFILQQKK